VQWTFELHFGVQNELTNWMINFNQFKSLKTFQEMHTSLIGLRRLVKVAIHQLTTLTWQASCKYSSTGKTLALNSSSSLLSAPDETAKSSDTSIIMAPVSPPTYITNKHIFHIYQPLQWSRQSIRSGVCVCVCVSVWTITFEQNDLCTRYLTLSRSSSKVNVIDQSCQSQERKIHSRKTFPATLHITRWEKNSWLKKET